MNGVGGVQSITTEFTVMESFIFYRLLNIYVGDISAHVYTNI